MTKPTQKDWIRSPLQTLTDLVDGISNYLPYLELLFGKHVSAALRYTIPSD